VARVLITGATGFLGARLVRRLAEAHEIVALVRAVPPRAPAGVAWLMQDLAAERWTVRLPEAIDAVFHLAQSPRFREFPERAAEIHAVSAGTTMRLLDWAVRAGARHFVLASTGGLYGRSESAVAEEAPVSVEAGPLAFYFAAKQAAELLAQPYAQRFTVAVLRCFFLYGSGQSPQMLMPRLMGAVQQGTPIYLQAGNGIRINPIHVDDAVEAFARCLNLSESGIFNIAGPQVADLRQVAATIGTALGRTPVLSDTTGTPNHLVADISRMKRLLWTPRIDLAAGIAELCGGGG
jgi:UDP-glucose 4-epimerase